MTSPTPPSEEPSRRSTVGIIGGCGRAGFPFALACALAHYPVKIFDTNASAVAELKTGIIPFMEEGGQTAYDQVQTSTPIECYTDPAVLADCPTVVVVIDTPAEGSTAPSERLLAALEPCLPFLTNTHTLILRSTVYPGSSQDLQEHLKEKGLAIDVACCPERVAQGYALRELRELPQLISAFSEQGLAAAKAFFAPLVLSMIELTPLEAELAKLFSNTARYLEFAISNQFYQIAETSGADYHRIHEAMTRDYPRLAKLPRPGFAAGPCLYKDTQHLATYSPEAFPLGQGAVTVNHHLPEFLIRQASQQHDLHQKTVGILGMAFKAESDDSRESLAYRLKELLEEAGNVVMCHDPYVQDESFVALDHLLEKSHIVFVGAPHHCYRTCVIPERTPVIDVWNHLGTPS
jgi:UDP-N-acetyl-D-mannosaminuronic acid dehydrogenase